MRHACLTARSVLMVCAAGLVLSATLSVAFSLGYAPMVGATAGAFLGLINFASLYRFGVRILDAADQSTENIPKCKDIQPCGPRALSRPSPSSWPGTLDESGTCGTSAMSCEQATPDRPPTPDGSAAPHTSSSTSMPRTSVLGNLGIRLATVVAGMAAVARWCGASGLLLCAGMVFAVQVPLFVSLAAVAQGRAEDFRLIWRQ
jgi:hypothetical protein